MNPFTRHPRRQGVTYAEHWRFATAIALRLSKSVIAFGVHALLPFVSIPRELDLESTAAFLEERNHWIESAGATGIENRAPERPRGGRHSGSAIPGSHLPLRESESDHVLIEG